MHWIGDDSGLEPFRDTRNSRSPDVTATADRRPEPRAIGDGTLGRYGNRHTTVRAVCGPGSRATVPKLLNVTARADYEDVSGEDRQLLARIARSAAEELTERVGCRTRLPALPAHRLASVPSALHPAQAVDGSCRWFARYLKERGQGRLPDRALVAAHRLLLRRGGARGGYDVTGDEDKSITAGTAGHASGAWWASSICDGKPALHTLSSSYTYDNVLGPQALSAVFRAYVDDIAKRRGCTHVTYPDA